MNRAFTVEIDSNKLRVIYKIPTNSESLEQWTCVPIMSHTHFRVDVHSPVSWMSRNSLLEAGAISEI